MPNKIGRFDILSEITNSPTGSVYKASDPESGQTVALKTLKLEVFGDQAAALVQSVLEEAETTKSLNSHNIALVYGAGELEGLFCAALEYVQGNSIATMLARKEGFSIWDLQDIARQTCQGLDHAHAKAVFHYSLEPAKIMVQWDGTVKMLGFGISIMSAHGRDASGQATEVLHYMSPEQLRGESLDARSNLFSLGAILYEMVTERKAFEGEAADQVQQQILEQMPPAPIQINRKIHPALSEVIMKALAKAPEERHQSGQDLVNDLERCKESPAKTAAKKTAQPAQGLNLPQKQAAGAVQAVKPSPAAAVPKPAVAKVEEKSLSKTPAAAPRASQPAKPAPRASTEGVTADFQVQDAAGATPAAPEWKAAVAAAGWNGASTSASPETSRRTPKLDPTEQFISSCVKASVDALSGEQTKMSAATAEPEVEAPSIKVDPMMAEPSGDAGSHPRSFSEIDELPPLKEIYIAPPAPPAPEVPDPVREPAITVFKDVAPEKPKIQPKEVAKKAVAEIRKTPPKLFVYSVAGAIGFILLLIVAIAFHIHNENSDEDSDVAQSSSAAATAPDPSSTRPAASAPAPQTPSPAQAVAPEPVFEQQPEVSIKPRYNNRKKPVRTSAPAPALIPGQLTVNSTPEGAQLHIDGRNEAGWMTPYNLTGLTPGQHTVTVTKPGYASETRTIEVASASKSFLVVQLAPLSAAASLASDPAGAAIFLDGKDTGRVTPVQISVEKPGNHTLLLKKTGYLEETVTASLQAGQVYHFAPTLRALGSTDEIKTVSRFKKAFGGGDPAGMGTVSIKTQPKGAQIAVNQRILDKGSPMQFYLNPGTYVIDITMSGFKPVHRVINVDKGGKVALDEILER
ncbi:MAG: PEGA domain-containing protein [Acidobacteriia bacterium]|nr:PEGA domain-containing protein [Terriglobia bacterium]